MHKMTLSPLVGSDPNWDFGFLARGIEAVVENGTPFSTNSGKPDRRQADAPIYIYSAYKLHKIFFAKVLLFRYVGYCFNRPIFEVYPK